MPLHIFINAVPGATRGDVKLMAALATLNFASHATVRACAMEYDNQQRISVCAALDLDGVGERDPQFVWTVCANSAHKIAFREAHLPKIALYCPSYADCINVQTDVLAVLTRSVELWPRMQKDVAAHFALGFPSTTEYMGCAFMLDLLRSCLNTPVTCNHVANGHVFSLGPQVSVRADAGPELDCLFTSFYWSFTVSHAKQSLHITVSTPESLLIAAALLLHDK